jgi:hypothetical protein
VDLTRGLETFITAIAMPRFIAQAEIGLRDGKMLASNAATLAGAGVLSVGPSGRRRKAF